MFNRILGIIILSSLLSAPAHAAWFLNTWVKSAGGTLVVRGGTPQTSANGSVYNTYTTSKPFTVTVNPSAGYSISQVNYNNVVISSPSQTSYTVQGPGSQNVFATFAAQALTVTASAGAGGSVNLASLSGIYYGTTLYAAKKFTFTPSPATFRVVGISGVPAGATVSPSLPVAANTPVTVTLPVGFTFTSSIALYGTFSGPPVAKTAPPQVVVTGAPTTLDGSSSTGTIDSYSWTQTAGPGFPTTKVIADNTPGAQTTFTPTVAGSYTFRLTVTGGSTASATVTVTDNLVDAGRAQCYNCHLSNGIGIAQNVFGNWSTSMHRAKGVICSRCHIGANAGGHPGQLTSGSVSESTFNYNAPFGSGNFCITCHSPAIITDFAASKHSVRAGSASCSFCHVQGVHNPNAACVDCHTPGNSLGLPWPPAGLDFHNDYTGTNLCTNCHNLHNPAVVTGMSGPTHYNNITSGMYPASYVTSRAACANCHYNSPSNASHRQEWNKSGHAATTDLPWIAADFKTMSGCVQCHTTTGFIAYSTGKVTAAWGVASDKTKEVLRCNGCHKDVPNGIVRTVAPLRPYSDDPYINRDVGKSNLCMSCHSGRRNGASITVQLDALADFTNLPFIDPHYHASGGNLHAKSGYHFPGQTYAFYSTNTHRRIGIAGFNGSGSSGPCVACHRDTTNSHTNKSLVNTMCGNCHGASFTVEQLYVDKQGYTNALGILNAMLDAKGHPYSPTPPNFSSTNWGVGQEGANTMGAAFNYVILRNDNGAYAHNSAYAKQLIFDSIDYLHNGSITGSIEGALSYLVTSNKITQETADSVRSYKAEINCSICHANSSGSHPAHLNSGFGCVDCHSSTAATNTSIVPGNTTHANGVTDLQSGPGRSFSYSAGTCSNISCHNNGSATWGGTLGCDGCHDCPPATASHMKHYGGSIAQAGYGNTGIAQDIAANSAVYIMNCGNCHPMDKAKHGNGVVDVELYNPLAPAGSLKALNPASAVYAAGGTVFTDSRGLNYTKGTCSNVYCHSYNNWTTTATIPENDPNWQAKVVVTRIYKAIAWGSAPLTCSGCHGNPTQTSSPSNDGGAGDSHSWIDPYGYQNLHTWNMGYAPLSCRYCHNDTVKQLNTYTEDGMGVRTLGDVPISNFSKHVNGRNDVAFDKQNPFIYNTSGSNVPMSLANATYDPVTKNCSNVSCHIQQTTVPWGKPYRWYNYDSECDSCHGYSN